MKPFSIGLYTMVVSVNLSLLFFLQACTWGVTTLGQSEAEIVFMSNRNNTFTLYLLDIQTKRVRSIKNSTPFTPSGVTAAWSPNGKNLAFTGGLTKEDGTSFEKNHPFSGLVGINLLDEKSNRIVFGPSRTAPAWSPDGTMIAFYPESCQETLELKVANIESGVVKTVTQDLLCPPGDLVQNVRIAWSPDGKYLIFDGVDKFETWYIWLVDSQGGVPKKLQVGRHPIWSPMGDQIAFDKDGDVWIMSIDGKEERQLVQHPALDEWPTWSPTGEQLAFVSDRDGNREIYRINLDGSGVERLTNNPEFDGYPSWKP